MATGGIKPNRNVEVYPLPIGSYALLEGLDVQSEGWLVRSCKPPASPISFASGRGKMVHFIN